MSFEYKLIYSIPNFLMVVVYYTQTYFLDAALETLQSLKKIASLHLLIELAPESKKSTVIDIDSLNALDVIESFRAVTGEDTYRRFLPYLEGISTVHFVVHKTKKAFSPISYFVCQKVIKFINRLSPDIIHFDTVSVRSIGLISLSRKFKIHITIHDPVPHSGEDSWKKRLTNFLFYRTASNLFFYSKFALQQFRLNYRAIHTSCSLLRFQPFSFLQQFATPRHVPTNYILFFGRMSPYKGIDILLKSIPLVLARFPASHFILAGSQDNYSISKETLMLYKNSITVIPGYLSTQQLADL
ncbi:MAG: glycosyltransferase, partial [bacterium]